MAKETTDTLGPRLPWAGKHVASENVEEELSRLWHMSADNMRTSQNLRVRTSVLNLVLCASDPAAAQRASALLRDLSSTHVARVVLLILDQDASAPTSVSTWVTIRSFPIISDIMRHNFEQITVQLTGQAIASSATILQPLLKPDLPVYLWWVDDLPDNIRYFSQLARMSNRVIVDSGQFLQPEENLKTLSQLAQTSADGSSAMSDLSWGRITPWRELVAQFFDVTEYKPYLAGVDYIEIEHAVLPDTSHTRSSQGEVSPNPSCALFLAAWLKTRLGWNVINDHPENVYDSASGTYSWHMMRSSGNPNSGALSKTVRHRNSGELTNVPKREGDADGSLHLTPRVMSDMPAGSICSIHLISNIIGRQASFTIDREDAGHVSTSVELTKGTQSPQRTVSIASDHKPSELLHDELEIMGRDHLYEETLQEVFDLLT